MSHQTEKLREQLERMSYKHHCKHGYKHQIEQMIGERESETLS